MRDAHDFGFFVWTIPGGLLSFGAVAALSIGAPFFLLGAALLAYLLVRGPTWPADLGLITGAGITFVAVAALAGPGDGGGTWLAIGLGLIAAGAVPFWWLRCRPRTPTA